jgi:apolipoprotein N-acyltransferase
MRSSERMERLWSQSEQAEREGAHVVVWPEAGAYPFRAQRPYRRDSERVTRRVLGRHRLPTIFGLATIERGVRWDYNTVAAMDEHGRITGTFDKVFLVPFGEYIPVVDPEWAMDMVPAMSHNLAGAGPAALPIDPPATAYNRFDPPPFSAGPLICFEDIFAGFARDITRHEGGIEVFVNVTIDTWFGDTAEPWEHLALAQFRSVEHRIPMVRSVAAGTSSVVDSTGTVVGAVPVRAPTASDPVAPERLVMDVALPRNTVERPTIYAQVGWLVPWLSLAASLGWLFAMVAGPLRRKYSARDRVGSNQQ